MKRLLVVFVLLSSLAWGACKVASPTGSGAKTGADWNNALQGLQNPADRTTTDYYYAGGVYTTTTWTRDTPDSGTTVLSHLPATAAAHCTDTGWNAGTMAATAANPWEIHTSNVNAGASTVNILSSYQNSTCTAPALWARTGYICKIVDTWPNSNVYALQIAIGSLHNITFSGWDIAGAGLDVNEGETGPINTITCNAGGDTATIVLTSQRTHTPLTGTAIAITGVTNAGFNTGGANAAWSRVGTVTNATQFTVTGNGYTCPSSASSGSGNAVGPFSWQEQTLRILNNNGAITVTYNYIHDSSSDPVEMGGNTGTGAFTFQYNVVSGSSSNAIYHAEGMASNSATSTNYDISYNWFLDIEGTSTIDMLSSAPYGQVMSAWKIYGNVASYSNGNPYNRQGTGDGFVFCQATCNNITIAQNSLVNWQAPAASNPTYLWLFSSAGGSNSCDTITIENNLIYKGGNTNQGAGACTNWTRDYNSYLTTTTSPTPAAHEVVNAASANPFSSWTTGDFTLASEASDWTGGLTLLAPYNVDAAGTTRGADGTWERGAFEFNGGTPAPTIDSFVRGGDICIGGSTSLTWTTTNATFLTITGIGTFGPNTNTTVTPTVSTTYSATASGAGGSSAPSTVLVGVGCFTKGSLPTGVIH